MMKSLERKNEKSEKCLRRLIKRLIDHLCMGRAGDQTQTFYHECMEVFFLGLKTRGSYSSIKSGYGGSFLAMKENEQNNLKQKTNAFILYPERFTSLLKDMLLYHCYINLTIYKLSTEDGTGK